MVNVSESAIKIVKLNERKRLFRSSQNGIRDEKSIIKCDFVTHKSLGRQQAPNPTGTSNAERGNPISLPFLVGKRFVRRAGGWVGLRCWKKQTTVCNGSYRVLCGPLRKQADVQLVFLCKKVWRTAFMEKCK